MNSSKLPAMEEECSVLELKTSRWRGGGEEDMRSGGGEKRRNNKLGEKKKKL